MLALKKGTHIDLNKFYSLMQADFDERELLSQIEIHKGMLKGEMELYIAYDDETKITLAYALLMTKNVYGYALLKYFAVLPWYRDSGIGVDAMRLLLKLFADKQGMICEIPVFEDNDEEQIKKLTKFFNRFGFEEMETSYKIGGAPAKLYVKPLRNTADITPVHKRIMLDFYSRCLPVNSEMIKFE